MIRHTALIFSVIGTLMISSCSAWLSVDSEDRIMENNLYKDTDGFYTALNGIYIDFVNQNLYSGTFGAQTPDILAQYYNTLADNHSYGSLALFRSEAKRLAVNDAWTRAYYLIMNINIILEHCEQQNGEILSEMDYNIIKGECLALRALLHFELFRYFGPVYSQSPAAIAIPYMDVPDPQVKPALKASEVAERLLGDLTEAEQLLETSDPVIKEGKKETDNGGRNLYNYRNLRMNYFAVKALAARVNMYLGYDYRKEALRLAEEVIDEASAFFPFSTREEVNGQAATGTANTSSEDRVLSSDVLFGVYNIKRGADIYERLFSNNLEAKQLLYMSDNGFRNLYPEEADLRTYQWQSKKDVLGNDIRCFVKYEGMEVSGKIYPYMIPVLRMSEMYLIAAECHALLAPVDTDLAFKRLNTLRNARQTSSVDRNIELYIENEYAREFIGEGQLLWYYKRKAITSIPALYDRSKSDVMIGISDYTFPLPQSEDGYRD